MNTCHLLSQVSRKFPYKSFVVISTIHTLPAVQSDVVVVMTLRVAHGLDGLTLTENGLPGKCWAQQDMSGATIDCSGIVSLMNCKEQLGWPPSML